MPAISTVMYSIIEYTGMAVHSLGDTHDCAYTYHTFTPGAQNLYALTCCNDNVYRIQNNT